MQAAFVNPGKRRSSDKGRLLVLGSLHAYRSRRARLRENDVLRESDGLARTRWALGCKLVNFVRGARLACGLSSVQVSVEVAPLILTDGWTTKHMHCDSFICKERPDPLMNHGSQSAGEPCMTRSTCRNLNTITGCWLFEQVIFLNTKSLMRRSDKRSCA